MDSYFGKQPAIYVRIDLPKGVVLQATVKIMFKAWSFGLQF